MGKINRRVEEEGDYGWNFMNTIKLRKVVAKMILVLKKIEITKNS